MKNIQIKVTGKVHDVFYRKFTKEEAEKLGLKGWVTNVNDGSVLIEAEGESEPLEKLITWCRRGPEMAVVKEVNHNEGILKNYNSFEILL